MGRATVKKCFPICFLALMMTTIPTISYATSAVSINASTLASYDIEAINLTPQTITQCAGWSENSSTSLFVTPDQSTSYAYLRATTLTVTVKTEAGNATIVFPVGCDGFTVPDGLVYNAALFALTNSLANMETGQTLSQACTKSVSCATDGTGPCVTTYGTQTQAENIITQFSAQNQVIAYQDDLGWGACN